MWEKVVGPTLANYHPKLNPMLPSDVDELMSAEVTMYVSQICITCVIFIFCIVDIVHNPFRDSRVKNDGASLKTVPLLGKGILHVVDSLFWNLPFSSQKQSEKMGEKSGTSEEEWADKWDLITGEHDDVGARQQLIDGWKTWLLNRQGRQEGGAASSEKPSTALVVMDD